MTFSETGISGSGQGGAAEPRSSDHIWGNSEMSEKFVLDVNERPSPGLWLTLSIQHLFAMFGATILVPFLTGLSPAVALVSSGMGTLLYIVCTKGRIPAYLGSSFAFITPIIAAKTIGGLEGAMIGCIVAGVVYLVVAWLIGRFGVGWLMHLLPPVVIGPIIMVIGLGLASVAIDMATGKAQSIRITSSSGLSKEEIDRLVKDAEMHADEDGRKKELVEAKNSADALIYSTEKSLNEMGANVDGGLRMEIDDAVANLKRALKGDDAAEIRQLTDVLTRASHKLAETIYQGQAGPQNPGAQPGQSGGGQTRAATSDDDDVVDADFQEVA